jgi:hypothetical protein
MMTTATDFAEARRIVAEIAAHYPPSSMAHKRCLPKDKGFT